MFDRFLLSLGATAGACGVALGALVAHAFAARLDAAALARLETAALYLLVHGLLLVAIALALRGPAASRGLRAAGALIALGVVCFCGGLIASTLTGVRGFVSVAPFGGSALIAGWLTLALCGWKRT